MSLSSEIWERILGFLGTKLLYRDLRLVSRAFNQAWKKCPGERVLCHSLLAARLVEQWHCQPVVSLARVTHQQISYPVFLSGTHCEGHLPSCAEAEWDFANFAFCGTEEYYMGELLDQIAEDSSFARDKLTIRNLSEQNFSVEGGSRHLVLHSCQGLNVYSEGKVEIWDSRMMKVHSALSLDLRNSGVSISSCHFVEAHNCRLSFLPPGEKVDRLVARDCEIVGLRCREQNLFNCRCLKSS